MANTLFRWNKGGLDVDGQMFSRSVLIRDSYAASRAFVGLRGTGGRSTRGRMTNRNVSPRSTREIDDTRGEGPINRRPQLAQLIGRLVAFASANRDCHYSFARFRSNLLLRKLLIESQPGKSYFSLRLSVKFNFIRTQYK